MFNLVLGSTTQSVNRHLRTYFWFNNLDNPPTPSAFTQARSKIRPSAFQKANDFFTNMYYGKDDYKKWKGHRVLSIDGTTFMMPPNKDMAEIFGVHNQRKGVPTILSRSCICYDVLNQMVIAGDALPFNSSERQIEAHLRQHYRPGDIILYDRHFPSYELFQYLIENQHHFVARVTTRKWPVIKKFSESERQDEIKEFIPHPATAKKYRNRGVIIKPQQYRLIGFEIQGQSERVVLATSLLDRDKYPMESLIRLYKMRWSIEECYKKFKCRLKIETFMGQKQTSVFQEFYAAMLIYNITSYLMSMVCFKKKENQKYDYQVNWSDAFFEVKLMVRKIFLGNRLKIILTKIQRNLRRNLQAIKPGRSFQRPHRRKYALPVNYKTL